MMRPTCPHHPSMRMRLVPCGEPLFTHTPGRHSTMRELRKRNKDERLIYRCPTKGCPRVEPHMPIVVPEPVMCRRPRCSNIVEASEFYRGYVCKECRRKDHKIRDAKRKDRTHGRANG